MTHAPYPKIELHVHLEGAVSPAALIACGEAQRLCAAGPTGRGAGGVHALPRLRALHRGVDGDDARAAHRTRLPRAGRRLRPPRAGAGRRLPGGDLLAVRQGAVGVDQQVVFEGFCDGAQEARETLGIELRLTPDITRGVARSWRARRPSWRSATRTAASSRSGSAGWRRSIRPSSTPSFAIARAGGLASVPHAGEVAGPPSIRGALDALQADRIRHGVRAVEDPGLLRELADRQIVLDVCVLSNVCLSVVPSVEAHQLPQLLAAGVPCTVNTDDPTFFSCDLEAEHAAARALGADPRALFDAGIAGALCDAATMDTLRAVGDAHAGTRAHPLVAVAAIVPAAMPQIPINIADHVGRTPMVQLTRLLPGGRRRELFAKLEALNPGGSVKDRIGVAMIEAAEREGRIEPGRTTIVEATSGNTGIALAFVCAAKGYELVLTLPQGMSREREGLLRLYGARVEVTESLGGMNEAVAAARAMATTRRRVPARPVLQPRQPGDPPPHDRPGDLGGDGRPRRRARRGRRHRRHDHRRRRGPQGSATRDCRVIAVEPAASAVLSGGTPGPHKIQGIGAGFVPACSNREVLDEVIAVDDEDAIETARLLARREGVLAGHLVRRGACGARSRSPSGRSRAASGSSWCCRTPASATSRRRSSRPSGR